MTLTPSEGAWPPSLSGLFARNTPNPQFTPIGRYHWFDGDGMVHGVRFANGSARYGARYIQTPSFEAERAAGEAMWTGILEPPRRRDIPPLKDTANTDLVWHNGQLIASWWLSGIPRALTADLETLGTAPFTKDLPRGATVAAHPKVDPHTQEMMFFGYNLFKKPYYGYGVVAPDGQLKHYTPIDTPRAHIPHDIAITPRFTILIDMPLGWDQEALAIGKRRIGFDSSVPSRFGIIPRHGRADEVRWFEAESAYMYHTIRAFERGDEVVLTGCRIADPIPREQDDSGLVARLDIIHLVPMLYEWRFNLKTGEVTETQLDRTPTEFPRVNDQTLTGETRYSYNPTVAPAPTLCFDGVIKYDLTTGHQEHVRYASLLQGEEGWRGGEVCFAPDPERADREDGGWIVSMLSHPEHLRSKLLLIDAERVTEGVVACADLPHRVPVGFHAEFVPL
jgi:carotenoid cleavage dioxygenase